jgi:hypothetical protein
MREKPIATERLGWAVLEATAELSGESPVARVIYYCLSVGGIRCGFDSC